MKTKVNKERIEKKVALAQWLAVGLADFGG